VKAGVNSVLHADALSRTKSNKRGLKGPQDPRTLAPANQAES